MAKPGPNEPCRCGSGRRYKRCCAGADRAVRKQRKTIGVGVLVVLVAGGIVLGLEAVRRSSSTTGSAFEYDAANDRYWHAEHGHWHDGPPPDHDPSLLDAANTPEPWHYDPDGHRHWHPDHGHWHDGFPPEGRGAPLAFPGRRPPDVPATAPPQPIELAPAPPVSEQE